jgi:hypothetical protein
MAVFLFAGWKSCLTAFPPRCCPSESDCKTQEMRTISAQYLIWKGRQCCPGHVLAQWKL